MSHRTFTFILINRITNEPDGCVSTHLDDLDKFEYDKVTHDLLTVQEDHPVFHEQLAWTAPKREVFGAQWDRQLERKSQELIDAEAQDRATQRQPTGKSINEVLLDLINEERVVSGKAVLTMSDLDRALPQPWRPREEPR